MTRVYQSLEKAKGLRALVVGAGLYPFAKLATDDVPALKPLSSTAPSVRAFLRGLLTAWRTELAMDLLSIDLLVNDPNQPGGATWPGYGVAGEVAPGSMIDPPTMANLGAALKATLKDAGPDEGLLLLFCGHGFSRTSRYYVASDFGVDGNPWSKVVDLSGLELGLRQVPPRTQWLFWDCCADIPMEILDALGPIGDPLIQPRGSRISAAEDAYGKLSRFGVASAPPGEQAFGIANAPSRFTEMLVEAVEGAGATRTRNNGVWWVDDSGIRDAIQTYAQRHPELDDPRFYVFTTPFSSDAPERIPFRRLAAAPKSMLIASSVPRPIALKNARITVVPDGDGEANAIFVQNPPPPGERAIIHVPVPPRRSYRVTVTFNADATPQTRVCYADLPLAEAAEFQSP